MTKENWCQKLQKLNPIDAPKNHPKGSLSLLIFIEFEKIEFGADIILILYRVYVL